MRLTTRHLGVAVAALLLECSEGPTAPRSAPPAPDTPTESRRPSFDIADGAHGGNAHFFFMPPLVSNPTVSGTADGTKSPVVTICDWSGRTCGKLIAFFSTSAGTGAQAVRYDATGQQYIVNWQTDQCIQSNGGSATCALDPTKTYRIRVLVGATELGHADVDVFASQQDAKNLQTGSIIPLVNGRTLPVKFRIEQGAIAVAPSGSPSPVGASGGAVTSSVGSAQVGLSVPAGAVSGSTPITIQPASNPPIGVGAWSPAVDLGPSGTTFAQPVTLTLSYDPAQLPPGVPGSALHVVTSDGTGWVVVPNNTVDSVGNTVSAPISHFSTYFLAIMPTTVSGVLTQTNLVVGQATVLTGFAFGYQTSVATYCYYQYNGPFTPPQQICYTQTTNTSLPTGGWGVFWSSSAPGVASVAPGPTYTASNGQTQSPTITAVGAGATQIVATIPCSGGCAPLSSNFPVTVQAIPPTPANDLAASCGHVITGIAFDGVNYYVGEGHDAGTQCVTRYTASGTAVDFKQFPVDIRGLTYVPALGKLVSRTYNGPLYTIDYAAGTTAQLTSFNPTPAAWGYQVQPAADPDGLTFWIVDPTTSRAEQHRLSDNVLVASFAVTGGSTLAPAVGVSNHFVYVPNGLTLNRYDKGTGMLESSRQLTASSYGCYGGLYLFARASYGFGASAGDDKVMYDADCGHARVEAMGSNYTHLSFASVSAGAGHVCALQGSGEPYCWGLNGDGQVGNGATADAHTPAMALGGPTTDGSPQIVPLAAISAGQRYTCGLYGSAAYCWGNNDYGQLGSGSTASSTQPGAVATGIGLARLSVGPYHACALTPAGAAYCWGRNDYGQLGNATQTRSATVTPVAVVGGHAFSAIVAEELTTCGLATDHTAWCWGNDFDGRLGDGGSDQQNVPVLVHSPVPLMSLAGGLHDACGLDASGVAYCWGSGNEGELGSGASGAARVPTAIAGLQFQSISPGAYHTCGIATSGEAYCWGFNGDGELGDGTSSTHLSPVKTAGGLMWTMLSAGTSTCGLATDGFAYCWGPNADGELGNGTTDAIAHPGRVAGQ